MKAAAGKKIRKDINSIVFEKLKSKFEQAASDTMDVIVTEYDDELMDVVTDRNSKTNPNFYRNDFIDRLNKFRFVRTTGSEVSLVTPDMWTFDFSGRLRVVQTILEGVLGVYVEMSGEDYEHVFKKKPVNEAPIDDFVSPADQVYLVRYGANIAKAERDLKKRFVKYPFSNTPPIRILEEGDKFVKENISRWINEALEEAQKEFVSNYKGVRL